MIFRYKGSDTGNAMTVIPRTAMGKFRGGSGWSEEAFYFKQGRSCHNLNGRKPNMKRRVRVVNYGTTGKNWPGFARRNHFAVRWIGSLFIIRAGHYRFSIASDDGSKLWVDNAYAINNDGLHGMRNREATRHLGSGPHSIRIEMFEHGGGAGMIFRYEGADTANKMIVVPETAMRKRGGGAGFKEEVFYFSQKGHCGNLKTRKPKMVRTVKVVNYANTGRAWPGFARGDQFAVRWTGSIFVQRGGNYRFSLRSDDGSKLYIDNKLVVNNDGLHGMRNRVGIKNMKSGPHTLRILFFEKGGHAGIDFKFKGPDVGNFPITVSRYFLRAPAGR